MRALVVDDSRAMRSIVRNILKEIGFEATEAGNGREALERLKTLGAVEVALVDWNMPEMDGYQFVCAVRADSAFDGMRVVMVTSETDLEHVQKALEAGANEYLMKPFTKEAVAEKLSMLGLP